MCSDHIHRRSKFIHGSHIAPPDLHTGEKELDKDEIRRLVRNSAFIPGVYNYCDRWCERCLFTSRCANYAVSEEHFSGPGDRDLSNKRFWDKLGEIFQVTLDMLYEDAAGRGLDLRAVDLATEDELEKLANAHECTSLARDYSEHVERWFDAAHPLFAEEGRELALKARLELPGSYPAEEAASLQNVVDVIRWYQHQIYVKLMRAVKGKLEEAEEALGEYPRDSDGSAKVALLGMDRSMAAWGTLLRQFPGQEDNILGVLVQLERLRKRAEKKFPAARAFVRPGFDWMIDREGEQVDGANARTSGGTP